MLRDVLRSYGAPERPFLLRAEHIHPSSRPSSGLPHPQDHAHILGWSTSVHRVRRLAQGFLAGGHCIRPYGRRGVFSSNCRPFPNMPSLHRPARHIRISPGNFSTASGELPLNSNMAPSTGFASAPPNTSSPRSLAFQAFSRCASRNSAAWKRSPRQPRRIEGNAFEGLVPFASVFPVSLLSPAISTHPI